MYTLFSMQQVLRSKVEIHIKRNLEFFFFFFLPQHLGAEVAKAEKEESCHCGLCSLVCPGNPLSGGCLTQLLEGLQEEAKRAGCRD